MSIVSSLRAGSSACRSGTQALRAVQRGVVLPKLKEEDNFASRSTNTHSTAIIVLCDAAHPLSHEKSSLLRTCWTMFQALRPARRRAGRGRGRRRPAA